MILWFKPGLVRVTLTGKVHVPLSGTTLVNCWMGVIRRGLQLCYCFQV